VSTGMLPGWLKCGLSLRLVKKPLCLRIPIYH
jgi:hypothetical protein